MKQKNVNGLVLWFTKITGFIPAMLFFKPKVYYVDKKVQGRHIKKGSILMSNHQSLMDFVLYLIVFFGNTVRYLMAEVLFNKGKIFSWFLFSLGGIYVNRDTYSFSFMSESIKILKKGGVVGIFPQGRLPVGGKPFPFKPSIAYIAMQSGSPIVPVYTDGNYGLFKRARVVIGTPICLKDYCNSEKPDEEELERLTAVLEQKTYELKEFMENREKQK